MTNTRNTPKEVFLHLLAMATLYMGAVNVLQILWQAINKWLPDAISAGSYVGNLSYQGDLVRFAISSLIIVFPVYLGSTIVLKKIYAKSEAARESKLRRWLTYVTLLIASLVLIGDLIAVLHTFLQGELTLRFFLKALSVFVVIGGAWAYYFMDVRGAEDARNLIVNKPLAYGVSIAMVLVLVLGFFVSGSPWHERLVRLDGMRVEHLSSLQYEIVEYYRAKQTVPAMLSELPSGASYSGFDPETNQPYEYRKISPESFEFCAQFATENNKRDQVKFNYPYSTTGYGLKKVDFDHGIGRTCFTREIDRDFLKLEQPLTPIKPYIE